MTTLARKRGLSHYFSLAWGTMGLPRGSVVNFTPAFNGSAAVSVPLMLQVVPYFMTGFESISKSSEEATTEFDAAGFCSRS